MRQSTAGELLALYAVSTSACRAARQASAVRLAGQVDWPALIEQLDRTKSFPLVTARLVEAGVDVPPDVRERLQQWLLYVGLTTTLVETETLRVWQLLEDRGIRAVALKGPFMARDLYGDPRLRPSGDVDLLVSRDDFIVARDWIAADGYDAVKGSTWEGALPLFETTLNPVEAWRPAVDLHWRLHWYEADSSETFLAAGREDADGLAAAPRRLTGAEQFAALLLYFCRDGLAGLRGLADIAAASEAYAPELADGGLVRIAERHPDLRPAFRAALSVAAGAAGVPAQEILPTRDRLSRTVARATRLASNTAGEVEDEQARIALVDLLLAPRGGRLASIRRHLLPPTDAINRIYSVPRDAPLRRLLARARFAVLVGGRLLPRQVRALWSTRHGRQLIPPID